VFWPTGITRESIAIAFFSLAGFAKRSEVSDHKEIEMTDAEAIAALTQEFRRMNRNLEMFLGLGEVGPESELVREVQQLVSRHEGIKGVSVWAAADNTGQVYLCVRRRFMQPPTCLPVDDLEAARAYLSGIAGRAQFR